MANKQAYPRTKKCKQCQKEFNRIVLSKRGLCHSCGICNVRQCALDLMSRSGIYYDRWLEGCRLANERIKQGGNNAKAKTLEKQA